MRIHLHRRLSSNGDDKTCLLMPLAAFARAGICLCVSVSADMFVCAMSTTYQPIKLTQRTQAEPSNHHLEPSSLSISTPTTLYQLNIAGYGHGTMHVNLGGVFGACTGGMQRL